MLAFPTCTPLGEKKNTNKRKQKHRDPFQSIFNIYHRNATKEPQHSSAVSLLSWEESALDYYNTWPD